MTRVVIRTEEYVRKKIREFEDYIEETEELLEWEKGSRSWDVETWEERVNELEEVKQDLNLLREELVQLLNK